ncbi:MAG: hydrogenase [Syntrophobacter sp.]
MILLIAYGNSLRRDDGAGFVLAGLLERLLLGAGSDVQRIDCHQLTPELSIDVAAEDVSAVVFLDTRVAGPSDDFRLHIEKVTPPETASSAVGHHMDAAVILAYAGALTGKPLPAAWLVTIPGIDFNHGEGFSETTDAVLRSAPEELTEFIRVVFPARSR